MKLVALIFLFAVSITAKADEYITHLTNIYRAPVEGTAMSAAGMGKYHTFTTPNLISGSGNFVYFTERGNNQVFRYNTGSEQITLFNKVATYVTSNIDCLVVRHDLGFFVCDQSVGKVFSFDARGELLTSYASFSNLAQPLGVATSPASNNLLIADGLFDHVIIFTRLGTPIRSFGSRGVEHNESLNIRDMAHSETEVYILDRLNKYIKVFDYDGELIRSFSRNEVTIPTAIAVDYLERVYVADEFDDTIKIYQQNKLIETIGGTGAADGLFRGITDLFTAGPYLYVVDSNNNRIQVYVINASRAGK
jgi:DNA-binding beta-propeller fold protein YncE